MVERGKLLVVEGGLGSGKSTQLSLLANGELENGWVYFREPGSTAFGELVRNAVQSRWGKKDAEPYLVHPYAALFAYTAARANLIRVEVIPSLEKGVNVGLDRFWYSTYAYQGAEGVSKLLVWAVSYVATAGLKPNLVLHYDLLPEIGIKRKKESFDFLDRYDAKNLEFHKRVRANYHQLRKMRPAPWEVIDASGSLDEVKELSLCALRKHGLLR